MRAAVVFLAAFPTVFRAEAFVGAFFAGVFRAAALFAGVFLAGVLRAGAFFAGALRAVLFRAGAFRAVAPFRAVFFAGDLRAGRAALRAGAFFADFAAFFAGAFRADDFRGAFFAAPFAALLALFRADFVAFFTLFFPEAFVLVPAAFVRADRPAPLPLPPDVLRRAAGGRGRAIRAFPPPCARPSPLPVTACSAMSTSWRAPLRVPISPFQLR